MQNEHAVSYKELLQELQNELKYHSTESGTSYRRKTAKLSLEIPKVVERVSPFLKVDGASNMVDHLMPSLDYHRAEDVSKMLHVIANDLHMNATLSDEAKAYVEGKHKNRKPLTLKR